MTWMLFFHVCAECSLLHQLVSSRGELRLLSGCHVWASPCSSFSCCGARTLGAGSSMGLQGAGLIVVVHWLICSEAWGTSSDQGLNPPALAGGFFTTVPQGKSREDITQSGTMSTTTGLLTQGLDYAFARYECLPFHNYFCFRPKGTQIFLFQYL